MPWALPETLALVTREAGSTIARIHPSGITEAFFGPKPGAPPSQRFHDPRGEFGICFFGESPAASFAETFLRNPRVRLITRTELARRSLTTFRLVRDLRLVKLYDEGLALTGCTAEITSSPPPYDQPQDLARALWAHPAQPDGIQYRCRHDNGLHAIAVYDRAAGAIERIDSEDLLSNRARLLEWRTRYGFEIA